MISLSIDQFYFSHLHSMHYTIMVYDLKRCKINNIIIYYIEYMMNRYNTQRAILLLFQTL